MIKDNIWHVYPQDDVHEHSLDSKKVTHFDEVHGYKIATTVECNCKCEPKAVYEDNAVIIVHNSFDGREGIEWVNEIL